MRERPWLLILFGLLPLLGLTDSASASVCVGWRRFSVITAPYATKSYVCEQCFGDAVQTNATLPDFCPSSANDVCQGTCRGTTTPCVDDSECASGIICDPASSDGVVVKCYGSANDTVTGNQNTREIIDLGAGDDTFTEGGGFPNSPGDVIQGGTGSDTISIGVNIGTASVPTIINGGPIAASGSDTSGDDTITDAGTNTTNVIVGGGGRDKLKGPGYVGTTSYGPYGFPMPAIADDTVGSLLCGGSGATVYAAGARHMCIEGGANCYYIYDFAVQGGRAYESTDVATVKGCTTFTKLSTGGNVESPSKASCGCQ